MKISKKILSKFQEGGAMPAGPEGAAPQEAPAEGGAPEGQGGDPMAEILQVAAQAVESQNCDAAMAVCQALMQLAQGAQGGEAPAEGQPVYRRGGRLVKRV